MGYIRHHAIVVTATYGDWIDKAHARATSIFPIVSPVTAEAINGTRSFFVPPDGSKEGWPESKEGDEERELFVAWLRAQAYDDGSSPLTWVEIQYGDDDRQTLVVHHSDELRASPSAPSHS